jgi:hypothetical protein
MAYGAYWRHEMEVTMQLWKQWAATIAAVASLLLAAGCETIRYELRPPTTNAGKACVTQCAAIKESCRGNELRRVRMNMDTCERQADSTVRVCLADASDAEKKKLCELSRPRCWAAEDSARCESEYRACFVQCGGTVDKIVTDH